jgi:C-terminal processing protease CtpA/Prc
MVPFVAWSADLTHIRILTPQQVAEFNSSKSSNKVGIGAEFSQVSLYLYVVSVTKGSNAEKAGLKAATLSSTSRTRRPVTSRLRCTPDVDGRSGFRSDASCPSVGREAPDAQGHAWRLQDSDGRGTGRGGKIGVIKVYSLEDGEAGDIKSHLHSFAKQGVQKVILDLRGVATGTLNEGVAVAIFSSVTVNSLR